MALGVRANSKIQEHTLEICHGDQLILYTDGVSESMTASGEIFGEQRLIEALERAPLGGAKPLIQHITNILRDFRQGALASDDLTMVVMERLSDGLEVSLDE